MLLIFLYLMNVVLITRASWVFYDGAPRRGVLVLGFEIQILTLLLLQPGLAVALLAGTMLTLNLLTWIIESRTADKQTRLGARLVVLACWMVFLGFLCSDLFGLSFNSWANGLGQSVGALSDTLGLLRQSHLLTALACIAGVFLAVVEANTAIRFLFEKLNVRPPEKIVVGTDKSTDNNQMEYNRGRVIGALERLMTFFFVLNGAYSALGFLIAAKGMTRFRQLDERQFAEYFLIGTLLSIILAGSAALLIQLLLRALL